MTEKEKMVYDVLEQLEIPYIRYEHEPAFTIQEVEDLMLRTEGDHCKNLFVRDHHGKRHYLVLVEAHKKADMKDIAKQIGSSRLSFASEERLMKYLGLTPGSVTPLALVNDPDRKVTVIVDEDLKASERICFHPNVNNATISMLYSDFTKFLKWRGNEVLYVSIKDSASVTE